MRLRPGGAVQWRRAYWGLGPGGLHSIAQGTDGSIFASGYQLALDPGGAWSMHTDRNGLLAIDPSSGMQSAAFSLTPTPRAFVKGQEALFLGAAATALPLEAVTVTPVASLFGRQAP